MRKTTLLKTFLLLCALVVGSSSAWADYETVATFSSADVVTGSAYGSYSNDDWSLTCGGNNYSMGVNKNNATTKCGISSSYGTGASTSNIATAAISENKIDNISQITFVHTAGSGNSGKIYFAYSTDGSTWNAIPLTTGTQGASTPAATTTMTVQFAEISSAYYAVILDKGDATAANFRFDNVTITFYKEVEASPLASIAVDASAAKTVFYVGDVFTHQGAVVTATYENASTKDVTASATFSTPDMTSVGTKTVTVSYTENGIEKTTSYDITVNVFVQPTVFDVNMNYIWLGSGNGQNINVNLLPVINEENNVTITITDGTSARPRGDSNYIRVYKGSTIQFMAPTGYSITSLVFTTGGSNTWNTPSVDSGSLNTSGKTWTGNAQVVTFTMEGSCFIASVRVTLAPTATVTAAGWATWNAPCAVSFPEGVSAYLVTENTDPTKVSLIEVSDVPANTPVLLEASAGTYTMDMIESSATDTADNLLHVSTGTNIESAMYVLAQIDGEVGFYMWDKLNGGNLPEGKIYLEMPSGGVRPFIALPGEETGISDMNRETITNNRYFDLQGRRVAQPTKGMYIVNGKKVVVK